MNIRKHYLGSHRTGISVLIAAAAYDQAATNEGERVEIVDGHAVSVLGDVEPAEIERFAADVDRRAMHDENRAGTARAPGHKGAAVA